MAHSEPNATLTTNGTVPDMLKQILTKAGEE